MNINYEIPEHLHRDLKVRAAQEGITLKALVIQALRSEVGPREMVAWCEVHGDHAIYQTEDGEQACPARDGKCYAEDYWLKPLAG